MSAGCVAYESDDELDWPEDLPRRRGKATPAAAFQPEDAGSAASAARGLGDLGMLGFFFNGFYEGFTRKKCINFVIFCVFCRFLLDFIEVFLGRITGKCIIFVYFDFFKLILWMFLPFGSLPLVN